MKLGVGISARGRSYCIYALVGAPEAQAQAQAKPRPGPKLKPKHKPKPEPEPRPKAKPKPWPKPTAMALAQTWATAQAQAPAKAQAKTWSCPHTPARAEVQARVGSRGRSTLSGRSLRELLARQKWAVQRLRTLKSSVKLGVGISARGCCLCTPATAEV